MGLWHRIFGKSASIPPPVVACIARPAMASQPPSRRLMGGSPIHTGLAWQEKFDPLRALCPARCDPVTSVADVPEWFAVVQAHVTAVQANDTAVRLFREGRLDEAIAELRRGLAANPCYATGYSNLGFLYLCQARLEDAVDCLLRALEVDPEHRDAPDHLCDVLLAFINELAQIGVTDGFLATQPGGKFDAYNRHIRTRDLGVLIAKIGKREVFKADGRALKSDLLMELVINAVQKKMGAHRSSSGLPFAWQGIYGWNPPVDDTSAVFSQWHLPAGR
jgi:TPR repeat